ncbi:uncharacterized protein LOC115217962 [Octopus vulgaris]|uniref:Uncharacterized protein LOC115217962 n=3 Tax=Octopus vulgaris TaxID=6645 RepID=A0AA36BBT9_OCTVU|nr:uncharacterized protein LOC115217962 [Octopus vulgaris]
MSEQENSTSKHHGIILKGQEIILDICTAENCCNGKIHCPFCDINHFKPTKSHRVRDHLELLHLSYAVQAEDVTIVKCFWSCGQIAGHYHCPYCPSKLLKRYAFTLHLHSHMKKMGKDKSCISVPDPKYPNTIKGYGKEIHLCKNESCYKTANVKTTSDAATPADGEKASESSADTSTVDVQRSGPHYHCPLCNVLRNRRSPLINHLWRCMEQPRNSKALTDNWKKATILLEKDFEKVPHPRDVEGLKYHQSIVRTLNDLPMEKCYAPDCSCGHKYHCPLCTKEKFKPNFLQHLQYHYYAHWKRRIQYKEYSVLLCNGRCELEKGCNKIRYHFHCPICGSTRRRRKSFARHLKICPGSVCMKVLKQNESSVTAIENFSVNGESGQKLEQEKTNADVDLSPSFLVAENGNIGGNEQTGEPPSEVTCDDKDVEEGEVLCEPKSLEDFQVYEHVIAKLSNKCLDALRDKGNIEEIFSDIALRTGAELIWSEGELGSLPVHELVGNLKVLEMSKDLVLKAIIGDLNTEQVIPTKQYEEKNTQTDEDLYPKNCMDASIQVEVSLLSEQRIPPSLEMNPSNIVNGDKTPENTCSNQSSKQLNKRALNNSDKDTKVTLKEYSSKRSKDNGEKHPESPATSLVASPSSPRKRGRPRKLNNCLNPSNIKVRKVDSTIEDLQSPGAKTIKRKRGRPRKEISNKVNASEETVYEKDLDDADDMTPDADSHLLNSKRYSTRGKKIDFSFLVGKPKKSELFKMNTENGLNDSSDEDSPSSETVGASCSDSGKPDEAMLIDDSSETNKLTNDESNTSSSINDNNKNNDNDKVTVQSDTVSQKNSKASSTSANPSKSKDSSKKPKSRVFKPLVMSDVAVLPTIRDLFTSKKRQRQRNRNDLKSELAAAGISGRGPSSSLSSSSTSEVNSRYAGNTFNQTPKTTESKQLSSHTYDLLCHLCGLQDNQFDIITEHLRQEHNIENPLRCDVCQRTFDRLFDLKSHLSRKHGPFPQLAIVHCSVCGKSFQGTAKLNWHMSFMHKITKEPDPKKTSMKCNQCSFVAPNYSALINHKETHVDDSKLCNLCGKLFSKGNHLITHIQAVHTKEKAAQCKQCGKQFNHIRYLRTHMKRHEGIKKHECNLCGWRFFESNTLKDHLETHKDVSKRKYRFTCDYCGQKHISKANFNDHLNKHTGNKPHKCQLCGKGFAFRTMLMKHQIHIHTTEKPFKCTCCDRAFKFKSKLIQHMVIHTGISKYVCQNCNKPFSCSATLKHHQPRCKGDKSWQQSRTVISDGMTLTVDGLQLEQQQVESGENIAIPVGDQNDIVIDMSNLSGIPEGNILQAAAQAAQLMEMPEVFMCSECNAVFSSLAHAESHVTTCRIDVATIDTPNIEIKVLDDQQNTSFVETAISVDNTSTIAVDNSTTIAVDNSAAIAVDNSSTIAVDNSSTIAVDNSSTIAIDNSSN